MASVSGYVRSLFDPEFARTGMKTALCVGTLLFCINHGPAFLRQEMNRERWVSVSLTYLMPYLVNVYGQYSYCHKLNKRDRAALASSDLKPQRVPR